jgi:asparagine synthase (glutamine-hydrolysing)
MCGIAGIRRFDGSPVDNQSLTAMAGTMNHRGPDEAGFFLEGTVGMAHRRLSIIDLGGSKQPMQSADGLKHLVFNGEILNYKELRNGLDYPFQTNGDTEVLLALYEKYGVKSVAKLRGQFAYALYDATTGDTHLFRDRLGILPLYYFVGDRFFAFASEVKALFAVIGQPQVDEDSLHDYLAHRSVPSPNTMIRGVHKLPQGSHLVVRENSSYEVRQYWELSTKSLDKRIKPQRAVNEVESCLKVSVRESLIADVPVGIYLSGGIDSSLLTAMARRENPDQVLHTFGASFDDHRYDESHWARIVSKLAGTNHHEVVVTADDFLNNWSKLSWHRDGPISEPSDIAIYRLAQLAKETVKVVLSGEGSDELFGGYPKYAFANLTRWSGMISRTGLLNKLEVELPASRSRMRIAVRALSERSYESRLRGWFAPFTSFERDILMARPTQRGIPDAFIRSNGDALNRMLYADTRVWLADNLLERADRMSMAASLETRPPFLDHRLVELAFSLPSYVKVRRGTSKWVIKEVARRYLPNDLVDRPKVGFTVPLDSWFRGSLKEMSFDLLTSQSSFVGNIFDRKFISSLLNSHMQGRRDEQSRIWTLLSLEVWHRELVSRQLLIPIG